jgi:hypothetical protein
MTPATAIIIMPEYSGRSVHEYTKNEICPEMPGL